MAEIVEPNYETVSATCDHCQALCIFNRVDDFTDTMPISGRRVACWQCSKDFWIKGDTINTPYQFLIDDARDHFRRKRYMPAIASLAQAWEVFFASCAVSTYVFRPFFAEASVDRDIDELNGLYQELFETIKSFTWFPLRNLVLNMLLTEPWPVTVAETRAQIKLLKSFGNAPSPKQIAAVAEGRRRETLEHLNELTIGTLRNRVVHKNAYRPTRAEVEPCLTSEISVLYRIKHRLGVGDFMEHQFGTVYEEP